MVVVILKEVWIDGAEAQLRIELLWKALVGVEVFGISFKRERHSRHGGRACFNVRSSDKVVVEYENAP